MFAAGYGLAGDGPSSVAVAYFQRGVGVELRPVFAGESVVSSASAAEAFAGGEFVFGDGSFGAACADAVDGVVGSVGALWVEDGPVAVGVL